MCHHGTDGNWEIEFVADRCGARRRVRRGSHRRAETDRISISSAAASAVADRRGKHCARSRRRSGGSWPMAVEGRSHRRGACLPVAALRRHGTSGRACPCARGCACPSPAGRTIRGSRSETTRRMVRVIRDEVVGRGTTVLLVTYSSHDVGALATRVVALDGSPARIVRDAVVRQPRAAE